MMEWLIKKIKSPSYTIKKPGYRTKACVIILYKLFILVLSMIFLILTFTVDYGQRETQLDKVQDIQTMMRNCDYKSAEPSVYVMPNPERMLNDSTYIEELSTVKDCVIYKEFDKDYFIGENQESSLIEIRREICTDYQNVRQMMLNIAITSTNSICFKGKHDLWFKLGVNCSVKSSSLVFNGEVTLEEPQFSLNFWLGREMRCERLVTWSYWTKMSILFGLLSLINTVMIGVIKNISGFHIKDVDQDECNFPDNYIRLSASSNIN